MSSIAPLAVDVLATGVLRPSPAPVAGAAPLALDEGTWPAHRLETAPAADLFPAERLRRIGRGPAMALGAAKLAVTRCPVELEDAEAVAVLVGTGWAEQATEVAFLKSLIARGEKGVRPGWFVSSVHNALASQVAMEFGWRGENHSFTHDALSFETALWQGMTLLGRGGARHAVVCGVDALDELQHARAHLLGELRGSSTAEPCGPCAGAIPGEGAAAFILALAEPGRAPLARLRRVSSGGPSTRYAFDPSEAAEQVEASIDAMGVDLGQVDLVLLGASGHGASGAAYEQVRSRLGPSLRRQARLGVYRHQTGEFATASALGLELAVRALAEQAMPEPVHVLAPHEPFPPAEGTGGDAKGPGKPRGPDDRDCKMRHVLLVHVSPAGYWSVMWASERGDD